jgi:hypothetical protein
MHIEMGKQLEYNKLERPETFLSSWADLVNRLESAKQMRGTVSGIPLADMFRWKASNSTKYELLIQSVYNLKKVLIVGLPNSNWSSLSMSLSILTSSCLV